MVQFRTDPVDFQYDEATELYFAASHDYGNHSAWIEPAYRLLEKKWRRGVFDKERATSYFAKYPLVAVAKQYRLEHLSMTTRWSDVFPPQVRREVAERLVEQFVDELELGNSWLGIKP